MSKIIVNKVILKMINFQLSCQNVDRLVNIPQRDFIFKLNNACIKTTLLKALLISDLAYEQFKLKSEMGELVINRSIDETIIDSIYAILNGSTIQIEKEKIPLFAEFGDLIGNNQLIKLIDYIEITQENYIQLIQSRNPRVIEYFVANYKSLDHEKLYTVDSLDISSLFAQILVPKYKSDMDSLFDLLLEIYKAKDDSKVFDNINIHTLGSNNIMKFMKAFNYKQMTQNVWNCISIFVENTNALTEYLTNLEKEIKLLPNDHIDVDDYLNTLINNVTDSSDEPDNHESISSIQSNEIDLLNKTLNECPNGIIKALTSSKVHVTASSFVHKNMKPENVLNPLKTKYFQSKDDQPNQWIMLSFDQLVKIDEYLITCEESWGYCPLNWELQTSIDGASFITVDVQKDNDIRGKNNHIKLNKPANAMFVKLVQTGPNTHSGNDLLIGSIEFFGGIFVDK